MPELTPIAAKNRKQTIWGIILLTAPTALFVLTFILFAVSNYVLGSFEMKSSGEFANTSVANMVTNIIAFLLGALAFLTWLPGIIVGIILLATRQKV